MKNLFVVASLLFVSASLSAQTPSTVKSNGVKNKPASGKVKLATEVKDEKSSTTAPGKVNVATEVKNKNTEGSTPATPGVKSLKKPDSKNEGVVPTNVVPGKPVNPVKPSEPKAPVKPAKK